MKHGGIQNGGPVIDAVIDLSTGIANAAIHSNANISIIGARLKVEGPSPLNGICFTGDAIVPTWVPFSAISVNNPKKLTFICPDLPPGDYTLQLTTQYTGKEPAKVPQTCFFPAVLTVAP